MRRQTGSIGLALQNARIVTGNDLFVMFTGGKDLAHHNFGCSPIFQLGGVISEALGVCATIQRNPVPVLDGVNDCDTGWSQAIFQQFQTGAVYQALILAGAWHGKILVSQVLWWRPGALGYKHKLYSTVVNVDGNIEY